MLRSLLFGALLVLVVTDAKPQIHDPGILEFTSQSYNLSISEKWTVNATAWSDSPERIGVYVPVGYNVVKFKIVKGDKEQIFQTVAKRVGDFAFLTICIKPDQILNRELQDEFVFVIKATTRRKNDATHEAQATVYLRVVDDNDLFPFFKESEYAVTIDEQFPVNGQIVQLEGVDADIGLNGQIYYSLLTPSNLFYVEPLSGLVEDRASRLFYNQRDTSSPFFRNQVPLTITVTPAENRPPKLSAQPIPLKFYTIQEQPAALLTVSGDTPNVNVELSSEVQARGDTFLRRQSSNSFLLSMARVTNTSPGPISLIVRDLSQPNGTFTAENIPLEMNATDRKVWFNGTTEEDTPRIRIQVNESAPVDHLIYTFNAMTTYADDQRHIKYRIHGKETHKLPFHIDKITGQLRVKSKMSYTQKSLYEISIVAKLEGVEEKAFIDVFLEVLSANNNCPQFKNLPDGFQLKLTSNKPNAEIYKVTAEDADTGLNAQLSYKLVGMNGSDAYFAVDPLTGSLKVTKELPGDHHKWLVKLMVIDAGRPLPQFATTLLQIVHGNTHPAKLTPIEALFDTCSMKNENSPKFLDGKTTFEVDENAPIGHIVGKVQATDKDQGYNGFVQYTTTDSYFGVDLITGEVFIQRSLELLFEDHKKDHLLHEIEVTAHDQAAENPKSTSTKVQIRINDVNNNAPEFEKFSYTVRVTENAIPSEEILRLKATDRDSGVNGRIEYRLAVDTDIIFVDPDSGAVRLEKALDREQKDKHQFLLLAVDRGRPPKFSFVNLTLLVEDSNNNAPNCGKPLHLAELPEDSPNGQLVLCMAAHDADQGLNAQLQYEMLDASFRIDRQTGCIFTNLTKPMDYELQNSYGFNVTVVDSGTPQLSTSCSVEVKLVKINKNQHQPRFTETVYEASIEENRPKHTELLTLKATDLDGTAVFYDLIEGDGLGYFELDRNSGLLRTATVIDYERNAEFWLTVRATDQDEKNPLSSYAHIYIKVIDLNDQKPLFSQPIYFPTVVENSEPNKVILRLNATDGDASTQSKMTSSIKFSIERGNAQSNFVLDENTGYLVTGKRPLDREAQSEHELYIQACDQGRECSTVLVVVTVLDQNDNKPTFKSNSFNLTVPANQAGFLTRVFASDADEDGPNSDLTYSLSDNTNSEITIDKFGRLFATEPLAPGTSIELTVVAEDNGEPRLRSTALVRLTAIAPVSKSAKSNQPPSFQNLAHWHHLYASDNDNVETILGRIDATDPDDGFAEIRDKVFIHVTRSSLSRPRFEQNVAGVEISEDLPVGYVLYAAKAHFDQSNTGISHPHPLSYAISYVTDVLAADSLRVDSSNGNLILEKPLNEAVANNFSVVISAKIGGGQENFALVNLHKKNFNRHAPKFLFDTYRFKFDPANSQIGTVFAYDIDSGENGQVTYSVLSGNEGGYFSLDQTSGQLTLQNSSNDMPADFTLTVRAVDSSKTSPLSSTCTVYLKHQIDGELDKKPVFKTADSLIVLDEQTKSQQAITTLSAASDSFIAYSTDCEVLNVHFGSGLVQMKQELGDASFGQHFNCTFLAINTLNNQTSGLPVQIKTIRRDNAQIRFERDEYESAIKEQASQKSPLFTDTSFSHPMVLHAQMINSQSSQSQAIRYRLLSPQETFFTVDSTSGVLKVAEPIDFEMYKHWTLQAIAHDTSPSNPKVSQPVEVQIQVVSSKRPLKFVNNPFEVELLLPTAKGTFVGQLRAISANNATLRYGLRSSSKFQSIFQIDAETGQLRVATNDTKSIEEREYKLDVQVSDRTNVAQGKVLIKAVSTDKLLHRSGSLKLAKQQYAIHVTENQTVNVQRPVLAIDWPLNANTGESFDFQLTTNTNNQLFLDSRNGLLYMNASSPIDRELTPKFDIAVLITSHQSSKRYAQAIVQINVNDINDCEPRFDQPEYTILLPQDAKVADKLLQTKATDLDLGANGIVRYSLANDAPNFVEINLNDGRILMKSQEKQLEIGRIYEFHIVASDQGAKPLSSRVKVQMKVVDRNQPIFDQATYNIKVPESAALETHLLQLQAKSNTDGELVYQIVDGDLLRQFEIGFRDGRLLINSPLDRERQEKYQLKVQVLDLSRQNVSATTTVNIQIEDVNDSPPRFEQDIYKYSVSESAPVGTLIGQIRAVDPDLTPKDNQITYQLVNDKKSILSIDQTTGEIHLSNAIDFERDQFLEFTVLARDSDGLSGEAIIQLNIIDANDNPAVFVDKSPLRLNIQSTNRIKEPRFLHEFKATDLDTVSSLSDGNKFLYSIVDGDETLFQLDTQNGILSQIRNFDANELATFVDGSSVEKQLNISLSDGLFSYQLQVTIVFKPTAGQIAPLQFNSLINAVSLDENLLINNRTVIDVLKVHGGRRPYLFSTPPTNGSWPFFVHPTNGNVFLARKLDYERLSRFVVPFTVQDANQQLAFMLTEINVQQGHDNAPRFVTLDDNGYKLYVSITANEGDRVGMIMAEDQDEDDVLEFAMVDFEEDSLLNPNKYFALDSTTGYLSVQAPIPANLVGQEIEFEVKVIDQGNPPHQHKVPFQLHITDAPVPQFSRLHFYFAISEESESGTLVGQLTTNEQTAKDVRFEMKDSEDLSAFALDKANGRLTLRQKLDRETKEQHQFVVSIQNSQGFVSYCFVTITVIDANDNNLQFL
ncbi:hypothetical protein M3Y97_00213900 [Aphelenchoides bicaudatus]|nr:hypothetical protein M3Y97_00213900 [Aphelenchoides bicaudatus]